MLCESFNGVKFLEGFIYKFKSNLQNLLPLNFAALGMCPRGKSCPDAPIEYPVRKARVSLSQQILKRLLTLL